ILAKTLMVSTDGGESWVQRPALPREEGYAFLATPFSESVAWRADIDHVFRTEDGVNWTTVVPQAKGPSGEGLLLALDSETALWANYTGKLWVTADGGDTWTARAYPK